MTSYFVTFPCIYMTFYDISLHDKKKINLISSKFYLNVINSHLNDDKSSNLMLQDGMSLQDTMS